MIFWTQLAWALQGDVWYEGYPVVDATVYILDERLQSYSLRTDQNGHFNFADFIDTKDPYRLFVYTHYLSSAQPMYYGSTEIYCDSSTVYKGDILSLELSSGQDIIGHIDIEDQDMRNGIVYAIPEETHLQARANYIEEDGSFSIFGLNSSSKGWKLEVESDNYPTQFLDGDYDDGSIFEVFEDNIGSFPLLSGIDVQGYIRDTQNIGVMESNVHVYSGGEVKTVQSEDDGWFSVEGLPPGEVLLWSSKANYATTYYPNSPYPNESIPCLEEGCNVSEADILLPSESHLTIHFTDKENQPIPYGSVLLYNDLHTVGRGNGIENGTSVIDSLYDGKYHLMIYAASSGSYQGWYGEIPSKTNGEWDNELEAPKWIEVEGHTEITIQLEASARFELSYMDELEQPVYGNEVFLYEVQEGEQRLLTRGSTDKEGNVVFSGLHAGTYFVDSIHQGYCSSDNSYTSSFGFSHSPDDSSSIVLKKEEVYREEIRLFIDSDHDKMSDQWEENVGLQVGIDDANDDPDEDGVTNIEEFYALSNPVDSGCSCTKRSSFIWILLPCFAVRRREVNS